MVNIMCIYILLINYRTRFLYHVASSFHGTLLYNVKVLHYVDPYSYILILYVYLLLFRKYLYPHVQLRIIPFFTTIQNNHFCIPDTVSKSIALISQSTISKFSFCLIRHNIFSSIYL